MDKSILLPVVALVALTFAVVLRVYFARVGAARAGRALALTLAWLYVACRIAHSFVHLTYNNVLHRLATFGASTVVLLALWVVLAARLI